MKFYKQRILLEGYDYIMICDDTMMIMFLYKKKFYIVFNKETLSNQHLENILIFMTSARNVGVYICVMWVKTPRLSKLGVRHYTIHTILYIYCVFSFSQREL